MWRAFLFIKNEEELYMLYELKLRNEKGNDVVHTKDFIKSKELLNALKLNKKVFEDEEEQVLALVDFVAGLFDVTTDEILEGIDAHDLQDVMFDNFYKVLGYGEKKRQSLIHIMKEGQVMEDLEDEI